MYGTVPPRRTVGTCGLSLCAVTTLQLLYGTLHIMVPTQLMCTHNHTTVGQYTTPTDEISQPNPRGTRAHAPLLPRGGEGESCARTPLFPRGFLLLGYRQTASGTLLFVPCVRVSVRAHTFLPHQQHHHQHPPAGGGGRRRRRPATNNTTASQPTRRRRRGGGGGPPHHQQQQHGSPFLLFLSFF